MSGLIHLYLVDEDVYPSRLAGDDESKYQALLEITGEEAIRWQTIEMNLRGFDPALQVWDAVAGNSRLLMICSFNFFPHKLIGPDADISGSFGFFPAEMVKDLAGIMRDEYDFELDSAEGKQIIAEVEQHGEELNPEAYEIVRDRYYVTFRDAAEQGKSVVILVEQ